MTRKEYTEARRLLRDNGRYALRWMGAGTARSMKRLLSQRADWMEEKQAVMRMLPNVYIQRGKV